MKLLCLSHDLALTHQIQEECQQQQWYVRQISERRELATSMNDFHPDMLLIDVESIEELEWWQSQGILENKPVLFLNKELTEDFVTRAFECGVDGLIPKGIFSRRMFAARVKSYLRRQGIADNRRFVPRLQLVLDSQRYRVEVQGSALGLTLTEFKILRELATDKEKVVSHREIQGQVFGSQQVSKRSLDVHICALRKKLGPYKLDIDSVRGVGYRLNPCAAS